MWKQKALLQDKQQLKESMKAMMTKKQEDKVSEDIAIADVRHLCL